MALLCSGDRVTSEISLCELDRADRVDAVMLLSSLVLAATAYSSTKVLPSAPHLQHAVPLPTTANIAMMASPPKVKSSYYKRPAAALERGGGFYVPGLEGSRLRVAGAAVLSVGLVLNRLLSPGEPVSSQLVSEVLGGLGILIVFAQSAAQAKLEAALENDALRAAFASRISEIQECGDALSGDEPKASRAKWAAAALLRLTPARAVIWEAGGGTDDALLLRFGRFPPSTEATELASQSLRSLLQVDSASSGGGSSACVDFTEGGAPPPLPSNAACVAVCACDGGVLAIASERLSSFSPQHIGWLEQCATLIETS